MYKKINQYSLETEQKAIILDYLESIERWDNSYHRHLSIDKSESLMVRQSKDLRNQEILILFNFLINNTSANVALNEFSAHIPQESPRYNRAALVSALDLIQMNDKSIKDLEKKPDFPLLMSFQKRRNELWFFIFDYLLLLGGGDVLKNYLSKQGLLVAA
jgi:hypothetical protein